MNVDLADKLGAKPIEPQLASIAALPDTQSTSAQLDATFEEKYGSGFLIGLQRRPGPEGLVAGRFCRPARAASRCQTATTISTQDDRSVKLRAQYVAHVTTMFQPAG